MITGDEPAYSLDGMYAADQRRDGYLTIRQYFAAKAMQGIVSNSKVMDNSGDWHFDLDGVIKNSVLISDALIAELNKPTT